MARHGGWTNSHQSNGGPSNGGGAFILLFFAIVALMAYWVWASTK